MTKTVRTISCTSLCRYNARHNNKVDMAIDCPGTCVCIDCTRANTGQIINRSTKTSTIDRPGNGREFDAAVSFSRSIEIIRIYWKKVDQGLIWSSPRQGTWNMTIIDAPRCMQVGLCLWQLLTIKIGLLLWHSGGLYYLYCIYSNPKIKLLVGVLGWRLTGI